ncbi:hypothetical protein GMST_37700 [Geomonas silvestris]|uniref:Uncharacterized protein n=1 Tax=Geomonas silvestris TaxID=2740184 RepID=A0A6V8MN30_9BACT|nr:hypothetical protein [Geomonas silvestris]GFO61445.1 hypothetical protein GMST_37700 [Geomonas silvestris]
MRITVSYDELTCEITRKTSCEQPTAHGLSDTATLAVWGMPKGDGTADDLAFCARSTPHPRRYSR